MTELSHIDESGRVAMVDVGHKPTTDRRAIARGYVAMSPETLALIRDSALKKGDALTVAQIAGILGAKRTSELIPLCHPLPLTHIDVTLSLDEDNSRIVIQAEAATSAQTGVEMEALTAVSVAALTVYDMAKAADKMMRIEGIQLIEKTGGKSGDFRLKE